MKLSKIISGLEYEICSENQNADTDINSVIIDSRKAKEGCLFVCLVGAVSDGHDYALSAYNNGARAFACQRKLELPCDALQILMPDTRAVLAQMTEEFYLHPERKLKVIGVTGTKGKTSVASYIHSIIRASGKKCVFVGTTGFVDAEDVTTPSKNTTPESTELIAFFDKAVKDGAEYAVIEVSSQSYLVHRVDGIKFSLGIFTNLSPDHIGEAEHPDYENYKLCKSRLFENSEISLLNKDDAEFEYMKSRAGGVVISYGLSDTSNNGTGSLYADNIRKTNGEDYLGSKFTYNGIGRSIDITVKYPGEFSVYNALSAAAACDVLGFTDEDICSGIENTKIKGRFETYLIKPDCRLIIDYAHNELSLRSALNTLSEYKKKRLICLFGSVGGRTKLRRETLGKAAGECADFCIISADNPDFEDVNDIISDIEKGIKGTDCSYICIPDRKEAIEYAFDMAESGDIVLLAGKGHEDYQLVRGKKEPFSEREIVNALIMQRV